MSKKHFRFVTSTKYKLTSRASNNALPALLIVQMSHLVVCATELEAEHWKQILTLEKDSAFQPGTQVDSMGKRAFFNNIVNS